MVFYNPQELWDGSIVSWWSPEGTVMQKNIEKRFKEARRLFHKFAQTDIRLQWDGQVVITKLFRYGWFKRGRVIFSTKKIGILGKKIIGGKEYICFDAEQAESRLYIAIVLSDVPTMMVN